MTNYLYIFTGRHHRSTVPQNAEAYSFLDDRQGKDQEIVKTFIGKYKKQNYLETKYLQVIHTEIKRNSGHTET